MMFFCFASDLHSGNHSNPAVVPVLNTFLPTFPIFVLFSSYIFVALTLINNIKVLLFGSETATSHFVSNARRIVYNNSIPLVAIVPPVIIAALTENVSGIVSYVGAYSGGLIQYVFPSLLAYYSRLNIKHHSIKLYIESRADTKFLYLKQEVDQLYNICNWLRSPFQHSWWIYTTGVWWVISLALVTMEHIVSRS